MHPGKEKQRFWDAGSSLVAASRQCRGCKANETLKPFDTQGRTKHRRRGSRDINS